MPVRDIRLSAAARAARKRLIDQGRLDDGHALSGGTLFVALRRSAFSLDGLLTGGACVAFFVSYPNGASLQVRRGCGAGKVQMAVDCGIVAAALFAVPLQKVVQSVVGAPAVSGILVLKHRHGRCLGV